MGKGNMRPTIRRSDTQRWCELGEYKFEQLCCDLHGVQKEIATCQLHGTRGQREKGVDHIAQRKRGNGKEVGQAKCNEEFNEKKLKNAVKPFFDHIEHWKKQEVRRYILFVACDIQRTQVHEEKEVQRNRFKDEGNMGSSLRLTLICFYQESNGDLTMLKEQTEGKGTVRIHRDLLRNNRVTGLHFWSGGAFRVIAPAPPSGRLPEATRSAGGASRQQGVLGTREIHFHLLSETPSYITDCYYNYIKICATDSGKS
jgi:hypothetical protein